MEQQLAPKGRVCSELSEKLKLTPLFNTKLIRPIVRVDSELEWIGVEIYAFSRITPVRINV